jgi:nicotinate dehydrogenase subunit A
MPAYTFRLNGRTRTVQSWDPNQPLLYVLRGPLGLTGAKIGCGLGQCGTCTVLVDDRAVRSCIVSVASVSGRRITTVEGLGTTGKPDPVQAAFIAEQAAQCGYCTPGMVLATKALLVRRPDPTIEEAKEALTGQLCRCGAYSRILRAMMRAARESR